MDLRQDFDQQRDVYINKMLLIIKVIMMMRMTKVMMMMMPSVSLRLERRQQRCTGALQDDTCQKLFESFLFNNNQTFECLNIFIMLPFATLYAWFR